MEAACPHAAISTNFEFFHGSEGWRAATAVAKRRGGGLVSAYKPPQVPPCPVETPISSNVVPQRGMKGSPENMVLPEYFDHEADGKKNTIGLDVSLACYLVSTGLISLSSAGF